MEKFCHRAQQQKTLKETGILSQLENRLQTNQHISIPYIVLLQLPKFDISRHKLPFNLRTKNANLLFELKNIEIFC